MSFVNEAHRCEQHRLVVVVLVETHLGNHVVQALAVVGQILGVVLKRVGVVTDTFTKQRLGCQVHLIHLTFKRSAKVLNQRHSNAARVAASLGVAHARTLDVLLARIATIRLLVGRPRIRRIAVIGEAIRCSRLGVRGPLLRVEDAAHFGGGADNDNVHRAFYFAHLLATDNLAEDAVLGDDALSASTASELFGEFTDSSGLQEVGEVLVQ